VEQLVEALRYKPEGRGFDSRGHSIVLRSTELGIFLGGKDGRCAGLKTLQPSGVPERIAQSIPNVYSRLHQTLLGYSI
jgi:hypothetical protein